MNGSRLHVLADRLAAVGLTHVDPAVELAIRERWCRREQATRILRCADGWAAFTLSRPSDVELVPALVGDDAAEPWTAIEAWCRGAPVEEVEARAVLLGLPVGVLPVSLVARPPVIAERRGDAAVAVGPLQVLDLSTMWAGPLCGALLAAAGHRVVKVEDSGRRDGVRDGCPELFDHLNSMKSSVELPLSTEQGRDALRRLIAGADVLITSARPRVWAQWGVDPFSSDRLRVWVAITAHGSSPDTAHRVGFGDDASVAGGLVRWVAGEPHLFGDAPADPLTGMTAAIAALDAVAAGGRWHLDVALSAVARSFASEAST